MVIPANIVPLITYVLISTFTPGPSNISSASIGVLRGYKNTLAYQGGLAAGVFLLMLLSGLISTTLLGIFPALEPILRYAGAGYILYLAFGILKASYSFEERREKSFGFIQGFGLQVLNPKLIVYAFTLFSTFLSAISHNTVLLGQAAFLLAAVSFCATSVWALFGTIIKARLHHPRLRLIVNILLSLSLVYAAVALIISG
jgi:cysteine/O-acetylserine efflux protein